MTEDAIKELIRSGLLGCLLVLALGAVVYLQKKRDAEGAERLQDMRNAVLTAAETNNLLTQMKEAITGLVSGNAGNATTLSTIHATVAANHAAMRDRDDRVERLIEKNGEVVGRIEQGVGKCEDAIDGLRDVVRARGNG